MTLIYVIYKVFTVDLKSGSAILMDVNKNQLIFFNNWRKKSVAFTIPIEYILTLSIKINQGKANPDEPSTRLVLSLDGKKEIIIAENIKENSEGYLDFYYAG